MEVGHGALQFLGCAGSSSLSLTPGLIESRELSPAATLWEGSVPPSEGRERVIEEVQGGDCWSREVWLSAGSRGPTGSSHIPFPRQPGASWSPATGPCPGACLGGGITQPVWYKTAVIKPHLQC